MSRTTATHALRDIRYIASMMKGLLGLERELQTLSHLDSLDDCIAEITAANAKRNAVRTSLEEIEKALAQARGDLQATLQAKNELENELEIFRAKFREGRVTGGQQ